MKTANGGAIFPSLRCRMGDWLYYVTFMRFDEVARWIKPTTDVHKSKKLSRWIQRTLDEEHAGRIADYILHQNQRLFNAIVVGVYGGQPDWYPLALSPSPSSGLELSAEQSDSLERSCGLLHLQGREELFAIDGQHRVAGIKAALAVEGAPAGDEVCAIFVGHRRTVAGRGRTRRLFTTLNKSAKVVSKRDIVALDEDNGLAVVTRMLVEDWPVLAKGKRVALNATAALMESDVSSITSIIELYEIARELHPTKAAFGMPARKDILRERPRDSIVRRVFEWNVRYWECLINSVPLYRRVLRQGAAKPGMFRTGQKDHLLFRPIGQRVFASAVRVLMARDMSMEDAVAELARADMWIRHEGWHNLLWDPATKTMMKTNRLLAETYLLHQVGRDARNARARASFEQFRKNLGRL